VVQAWEVVQEQQQAPEAQGVQVSLQQPEVQPRQEPRRPPVSAVSRALMRVRQPLPAPAVVPRPWPAERRRAEPVPLAAAIHPQPLRSAAAARPNTQ
jgi:hypothetical protein